MAAFVTISCLVEHGSVCYNKLIRSEAAFVIKPVRVARYFSPVHYNIRKGEAQENCRYMEHSRNTGTIALAI